MGKKEIKESSKSIKKFLTNIILIILICIFVYSTYQIILWYKDEIDLNRIEEDVFSKVKTKIDNEVHVSKIDFDALESINKDIFAWIEIENTNIDYPILQGETDEYYLRKDIYGKYNHSGCIFVDSSTHIDFSDDNTVVYGHNLKNGKMFSELKKIYDGILGNDVSIKIYTKEEDMIYKVFSVYIGEQDLKITQKNFSQEKKEEYMNELIQKSSQNFLDNIEIDYSNNILTLVTCGETNEKRIVVTAIKL